MVNKPKNKIVTHQCSSQEQIKRRSGKPKGVKQNILPSSGQWCEDHNLKNLIIYLTKIGRFNNHHNTGTKLKNSTIKKIAQICRRYQKFQGNLVYFFNTQQEQQNLDQLYEEMDSYGNEINRTLIEKLGQLLEISFLKEMIYYIRLRPEEPFQLFQGGGLQKQFQVVQANFVKYLDTKCVGQENIDIQTEFEIFKTSIDTKNIEQDYKEIANHFKNQELFLK